MCVNCICESLNVSVWYAAALIPLSAPWPAAYHIEFPANQIRTDGLCPARCRKTEERRFHPSVEEKSVNMLETRLNSLMWTVGVHGAFKEFNAAVFWTSRTTVRSASSQRHSWVLTLSRTCAVLQQSGGLVSGHQEEKMESRASSRFSNI